MEKQFWITLFADSSDETLAQITTAFVGKSINIGQLRAQSSLLPTLMQYDIEVSVKPEALKDLKKMLNNASTVHKLLTYEAKDRNAPKIKDKIKDTLKTVARRKQSYLNMRVGA
ncbi:hypothetical protein [Persicobacter psychrovividus]|uniref:ACT domain-containing protein n=1 Tax=Persicobacter psychrovividus TaxID=387638 RepID=A0ABM7VFJ2_9BACT|nr:hypothetical protein PEPS_20250 [Persicobacter psychrovividus]